MVTIVADTIGVNAGTPRAIRRDRRKVLAPFRSGTTHRFSLAGWYAAEADGEDRYEGFTWHLRGAPVTIDVAVRPGSYLATARCDLEQLRSFGGRMDQTTDHPYPYDSSEFDHWREYARYRGEFEHYWWPRLLHEIDDALRRGADVRERFPLGLRDGMYYPHGPWAIVPHASTDYRLAVQQELRAGKNGTPLRLIDALFSTRQIEPSTMTIEYSPPTEPGDAVHRNVTGE